MLKIYFNEDMIKISGKPWVPFLFPILWDAKENIHRIWLFDQQVQNWINEWKNLLIREYNILDCDYMVFPIEITLSCLDMLEEYCKVWKKNNKKIVGFYFTDNEYPIPNKYDNLIIFRTSLNKNNPRNEFAMPWFTADLWKKYWIDREINNLCIWYCGYCWYYNIKSFFMYIFTKIKFLIFDNDFTYKFILYNKCLIKKFGKLLENFGLISKNSDFICLLLYILTSMWKWIIYRHNVIKKIKSIWIESNIIERKKMINRNVKKNLKNQYAVNIKSSLFPLVMRGNGNYSFRLSEVLSLWRIPLFIDTDCRLPFEDSINYREVFCRCDYKNLWEIENVILKFYKNKDLIKLQRKMREIYESYFSFFGFHKEVVRLLTK